MAQVLENPGQVTIEEHERRCYQSQVVFPNGKTYLVRAIVDQRSEPAAVVPVYRTSKIAKYWRSP